MTRVSDLNQVKGEHMRYRRTLVGLVVVLSLASLSFKCGSGQPGDDPVRKAAKAADTIAGSITEMIKLKRQLAQQKTITPDEELALTNALLKANTADKAFLAATKQLKGTPTAADKSNLATLFSTVSAAVNEIDADVLGVKNPDSRTKLTTILNTIKASLAVISSLTQ
jgi:hypothetical protein